MNHRNPPPVATVISRPMKPSVPQPSITGRHELRVGCHGSSDDMFASAGMEIPPFVVRFPRALLPGDFRAKKSQGSFHFTLQRADGGRLRKPAENRQVWP